MTGTTRCHAAIAAALLFAVSPARAESCTAATAHAQAQVDAAIANKAASDGWRPESLAATRNYQPTPRSLVQSEGRGGFALQTALDTLNRARAADHTGDVAGCRRELARVKSILRAQR